MALTAVIVNDIKKVLGKEHLTTCEGGTDDYVPTSPITIGEADTSSSLPQTTPLSTSVRLKRQERYGYVSSIRVEVGYNSRTGPYAITCRTIDKEMKGGVNGLNVPPLANHGFLIVEMSTNEREEKRER